MSAIRLEGVGKLCCEVVALSQSDLTIPAGSFTVFLGPSDCGKTTTLGLIAGLNTASGGRISINEIDASNAQPAQRGASMVLRSYALFPHLSVADNLLVGLQVRKAKKQERSERLSRVVSLVRLEKLRDRKPSQLSGGQQQRVALVAKTNLLDERTVVKFGRSAATGNAARPAALRQKLGLTVVQVTHDQTEAMSTTDQVVLRACSRRCRSIFCTRQNGVLLTRQAGTQRTSTVVDTAAAWLLAILWIFPLL